MKKEDFVNVMDDLYKMIYEARFYYVDKAQFAINEMKPMYAKVSPYSKHHPEIRFVHLENTGRLAYTIRGVHLDVDPEDIEAYDDVLFSDYESAKQKLIELHTNEREKLLTEKSA